MVDYIAVKVALAWPDRQQVYALKLPPGSHLMHAIEASGVRRDFPGVPIDPDRLGIFAQLVPPDTRLQDGDRVEIYRPLQIDPKDARRRRVAG